LVAGELALIAARTDENVEKPPRGRLVTVSGMGM